MSDTAMNSVQSAADPATHAYAIIDASGEVVNRIVWDGQGNLILPTGQYWVEDDASAYPIGSTYKAPTSTSGTAG